MTTSQTTAWPSNPLYANFGFQVLVALVLGLTLGMLAIDPFLDMGRTAVNVAGQALVPTIVAKRQGDRL